MLGVPDPADARTRPPASPESPESPESTGRAGELRCSMKDDLAEREELGARLRLAVELCDFGIDLMRENLRRDNPTATEPELDVLLAAWLRQRPGAEDGDAEGVPVSLPRATR